MASSSAAPASAAVVEKRSAIDVWRRKIGLPLTIAVVAALLLMPTPAGLTVAGQKAIAVLAGLVVLFLTEPMELPVASIAVVPAVVLLGLANVKVALEGFATPAIFLLVGSVVMSAAMEKTRLAERFTYWLLANIGCSARNITFGIMVANIALAFMVPSTTARTAIMLPMCLSIIAIFRKSGGPEAATGRSNFAVGLLLTMAFTNSTISAGILTASTPNPVTIDFIAKAGRIVTYFEWMLYGFPPALVMTLITWWFLRRVYRPERESIPGGEEYMRDQLRKMGRVTGGEWRALFVFLLVVGLWMTGNLTKIDVTVACLFGLTLLFVPKLGCIEWKDINRNSAFYILMINGGGLTAGDLLLRTGAAKWIANHVFNGLGLVGASSLVVILVVLLVLQFARIGFMGTTPMAVIFMPLIVSLASTAKLPVASLALPAGMIIAGYPLLMFYNTLPNILVYGTGELKMEDFPRVGFILCAVAIAVYAIFAVTYWRWLKLF